MGLALGNGIEENEDKILDYINKCLELKCRLIEIHPFQDGNGRVGRLLVSLYLYKSRVINFPFFYISIYPRYGILELTTSILFMS